MGFMTLMESARKGVFDLLEKAALTEGTDPEFIRKGLASGRIVIPHNPIHSPDPLAIGKGLRVKVNANIGTSKDHMDIPEEMDKARVALEYGADAIMDLSIGGDTREIRRTLLKEVPVIFGSVPVYEAGIASLNRGERIVDMTEDDIWNSIEDHAKDGVDFVVVHAGVNRQSVGRLKLQDRIINMVSRGGSFHTAWIEHNDQENPLYENFDYLLELARKYELTLSLGDGFRSGSTHDANDRAMMQELITIGELVQRCRDAGVQSMVEGPGHVPLNQIASNVQVMKSVTKEAPYYVLGPLVTDIAPGYDHITGAIGGAIAGHAGVDFLCYVTPSEHLCLPNVDDVRRGVVTSRIAAHAADLANGLPSAIQKDYDMSKARNELDWEKMFSIALDPVEARRYRQSRKPTESDVCSMCGEACAIRLVNKSLE